MKFNINITEALCGFKKAVTTLDDRTLIIQTIPGKYPFITPSLEVEYQNLRLGWYIKVGIVQKVYKWPGCYFAQMFLNYT